MNQIELLEQIRGRGKASVETALSMFDLYSVSDLEGKHRAIEMATRGLPAREVVGRFIQAAAEEKDDELLEHLIAMLFWVDIHDVPDVPAWIALLASCLDKERVRGRAAACLSRIIAGNEAAQEALVAAARKASTRSAERQILSALCTLETPPPAVRALFLELLPKVDEDAKAALLARLISAGALSWEAMQSLLSSTEPFWVKRMVLEELVDRPLAAASTAQAEADAALLRVLAKDPEPELRRAAADALASRGGRAKDSAAALLHTAQHDPHTGVRAAAMLAFDHSLAKSDEALAALAKALSTERTRAGLELLLALVTSHPGRSPAVRAALLDLLRADLRTELLEPVIQALGKLAARDEELSKALLATLETEKDQRVRGSLLEALLRQPDAEGKHLQLYLAALKSSDARIRALGVKGLLRVPLQPVNLAALNDAVLALKDPQIDRWSRVPLARKLARLSGADPQRALAKTFKEVAAQTQDSDVRAACEEAADKAAAAAAAEGGAAIDWNEWFQRVEVEHRTDGIFPDLFVHFDEDPAAARRILRAALNPPASETLYSTYRGQLTTNTIIGWLRDRNLVDDDVSRFCIAYLSNPQNYGGDRFFLGVLKSNPSYGPLKDELWKLLELRKEAPPVLLRELFLSAYAGSEAAFAADLKARLAKLSTPAQAIRYLTFLAGNAPFGPAQEGFLSLSADAPVLNDPDAKKLLEQLSKAMNLKLPVKEAPKAEAKPVVNNDGPGLADD